MIVDLTGKVVVVTGAGGILAGNFSTHLAKAGAKVALLDINLEKAEAKARQIRESGGDAHAFYCDVLSRESIEKAEQQVVDCYGEYHILINGAGGANNKVSTTSEKFCMEDIDDPTKISIFDLDANLFDQSVRLNLMGTFLPTQVFLKGLMKQPNASVLNFSSMNAFTPLTRSVAYSNAKAAVTSLTKWLAVHLSPLGIRVNAIAPGFFLTTQNRDILVMEDGSLSHRAQKMISNTPLGRLGDPDDLVGLMLFLCDETASGFINGAIIPVDGGYMAMPNV